MLHESDKPLVRRAARAACRDPGLSNMITNLTDAVARASQIIKSQQGRQRVPRERLPRGRRAVAAIKK